MLVPLIWLCLGLFAVADGLLDALHCQNAALSIGTNPWPNFVAKQSPVVLQKVRRPAVVNYTDAEYTGAVCSAAVCSELGAGPE